MIFAMGSLVALQWYWIKNSISVKKEQFDRNVKTALMETVRKIEQEEVLYVAQQRLTNQKQNRLYATSTQKINDDILRKKILEHDIVLNSIYNETFFREFNKKIENLGERVPENRGKATEYINEKLRQENDNLKKFIKSNDDLESKFSEIREMNQWMDSTGLSNRDRSIYYSGEVYSSGINLDLVKGIIHDLMLGERSISERMGTLMVDTLLRNELQNMGISIPFQYAVEDKGQVVLASLNQNIEPDSYKIRLFPGDSFQNNQFLYVAFPQKDNFILKNLVSLFAISTLLVLLVGGIFYYSANSLISERKLAKVKNDFINNMTHELKTPVSSISLALEVIQDKDIIKTEEKTNRYLGIIKEENQRLASQIDKVLQMAKLEQKQVQILFEPVDVNEIINAVIKNMEVQLEQKTIQLNLQLVAENTIVRADRVHLTNVFYNLLDNALKYSKESLDLQIITENPSVNEIKIEVIDNGIGIDASETDRVFEKFYRVSTGDLHDVKGFGLGLSYVKNMVKLHEGSVDLKSKLNAGSTFTITLPLDKS
jgi:two-component system phosphate regulon sensor histidine kinase PhoR